MRLHNPYARHPQIGTAAIYYGWEWPPFGLHIPRERVLSEVSELGLAFIELGPPGFFPRDGAAIRDILEEHRILLSGGFGAVTLHNQRREAVFDQVARQAQLIAQAGGKHLVVAAGIGEDGYVGPRPELTSSEWDTLSSNLIALTEEMWRYDLIVGVHPHWRTHIQTETEIRRLMDLTGGRVKLCLDTGHVQLAGGDPVAIANDLAEHVDLVHAKSVRDSVAAALRAEEIDYIQALDRGVFQSLAEGDVDFPAVVRPLQRAGFDGPYILERDQRVLGRIPPPGQGPIEQIRADTLFLQGLLAPQTAPVA
jgi:inosose dehydratase